MRTYSPDKVVYFNQHQNKYAPESTCNLTAVAMALTGFGFIGGGGRFPDELYVRYNADGSRFDHNYLRWVVKDYSKGSLACKEIGSLDEIKEALLEPNPVIVGGDFTQSGHIIQLSHMENGFIIANDSNGVFEPNYGTYNTWRDGKHEVYKPQTLLRWLTKRGPIIAWSIFGV